MEALEQNLSSVGALCTCTCVQNERHILMSAVAGTVYALAHSAQVHHLEISNLISSYVSVFTTLFSFKLLFS